MSDLQDANEYGCVYACIRFDKWASDWLTEEADFGKKIIFSDEAHFDFRWLSGGNVM